MRPIKLTLRGVTRFTDPVTVDLEHLPPGLVCFEGPNGEGKTTIMEALGPAALWRTWPSKPGTMLDNMHGRDARLALTLDHQGRRYEIELLGDTKIGKLEAHLRRDGEPISTGRCPDYDDVVQGPMVDKRRTGGVFPPELVFMASAYAAQNAVGNFRSLDKAQRRDLFSMLLGNENMQRLAERARALAGDAGALLDEVETQAADLLTRQARAVELDGQIVAAREALPPLEAVVAEREAAHQALTTEHAGLDATLRTLETARTEAVRRRDRLAELVRTLEGDRPRIEGLIASDEALLATADQVHADAQALVTATADVQRLLAEHRAAQGEAAAAQRDADAAAKRERELLRDLAALEGAIREGKAAAELLPGLEARAARLGQLTTERANVESTANEARRQRDQAEIAHRTATSTAGRDHARAAAAVEAAEGKAALLGDVPCAGAKVYRFTDEGDGDPEGFPPVEVDCGTCRFLVDARAAEDALPSLRRQLALADEAVLAAARLEADLQAKRAAEDEAREALRAVEAQVREHAGVGAELAAARAKVAAGEQALARDTELGGELVGLRAMLPDLATDASEAAAKVQRLLADGQAARERQQRLAGADQRLRDLEAAQARLPERRAALARLVGDLEGRRHELAEVVVPDDPVDARARAVRVGTEVAAADAAKALAQRGLRAQREALARLEGQRAELGDLAGEAKAIEAQRLALTRRREGFRLIERALGRDGVQALEIDAAAPRVSDLANDLLRASYGPRFTVELQTIRPAEGNRKQREVFDVIVHDGERPGGPRAIESYSGGEAVLLDEALKLALALFNAERHGVQVATLWRDECDGKLDAENARRYPPMLRRAMGVGGFRNVFYVSHRPEVIAQADAVVHVEGGRARLDVLT